MTLIEMLKRALEWDDPYDDMPDYKEICEHLGIDPGEDPETVKEAIEMELADLETTEAFLDTSTSGEPPDGVQGGDADVE